MLRKIPVREDCGRKHPTKYRGTYRCGYCIAAVKARYRKDKFRKLLERAQKDPTFGKHEYTILLDK